MSQVCRCCLSEGLSMKNLFSFGVGFNNGKDDFLTFAAVYNLSTNLNLCKESKLPINICLSCEVKLIASYKFRIQCRNANENLKKIQNCSSEVKGEDFWDDEFLYKKNELQSYNIQCKSKDEYISVERLSEKLEKSLNDEEIIKEKSSEKSEYDTNTQLDTNSCSYEPFVEINEFE